MIMTEPKEQLTEAHKTELVISKMRRELAQANLRTASAQADAVELGHSNLILRFGIQYGLNDGDEIGDDGTITRKQEMPKAQVSRATTFTAEEKAQGYKNVPTSPEAPHGIVEYNETVEEEVNRIVSGQTGPYGGNRHTDTRRNVLERRGIKADHTQKYEETKKQQEGE
jgi:hypothetical protein